MLLKEDKCKIEIQGEMTMERLASFHMLYAPLLGSDATCLYQTLLAIGTRQTKIKNHLLIASICKQSMEVLEKSRRLLEQYLLVKTFYDAIHNCYLYQIYMPKCGNDFLRHEVFGRLYMKEMGKQVYEFNKLCFAHQLEDKRSYQEITIPFENVLKEDWEDTQEELFKKMKPQQDTLYQNDIPLSFNFDRFLTGFSSMVFPLSARSGTNLHAIGELATIHGIDEMDMRKYVSQSMDLKQGKLNMDTLKKLVRNAKPKYEEIQAKDPYSIPPVIFLQRKQHGINVSKSDKFLIENLISEYKMKPEVVNVLIEYVLQTTNQRFTRSYVEKVASVWIRLGIDTSEKALALIAEEQTGTKTKSTEKKALPKWYDDQDLAQEQVEEIDDATLLEKLKKLKGE